MLPGCDAVLEFQTKQTEKKKRPKAHGKHVPSQPDLNLCLPFLAPRVSQGSVELSEERMV
jgi:hypothetical protein